MSGRNPASLISRFPNDLNAQIDSLVADGYFINFRNNTHAQLVKKKQFSLLAALLWLIFANIIGVIIYIIYFLCIDDDVIDLNILLQEIDLAAYQQRRDANRKLYTVLVIVLAVCVFGVAIIEALNGG